MKKTTKWTATATYAGNANIKELIKKYKIKKLKRNISYEARIMLKQLFWLKVAIALFLIEIGFYAFAIYKLLQLIN